MKTFLVRTVTGILFITVVITSILFSDKVDMLMFNVFLVFTCIALYEYRNLLLQKNIKLSLFFFYAISLMLYFILSFNELRNLMPTISLFSLILVMFLLLFIVELFRKQENPFIIIAYSILGIVWIVFPFSLINHIPSMLYGGKFFLLSIFLFVWMYDTFAYCVGSLLGKHRLMPRISPKKSWEGAIGAAVLTMGFAFFMPKIFTMLPLTAFQWVLFAAILVVASTLGDLAESMFKRQLSVKDSGTILPGHGGILDRFDSILFVIPFVILYLTFIL